MSDDEWEEIKMKVSNIRLSLAPAVKYSVLHETFPKELGKKLEKSIYVKVIEKLIVPEERNVSTMYGGRY
jgi:hypothetical protein